MSFTLSEMSVPDTRDRVSNNAFSNIHIRTGLPRSAEIILSLAGLIVFAPLIALAAIAILLSSPGPVIFRQKRVGRNGHSFTLYKLRTMHQSREGAEVTIDSDRRIFRAGRILRKTKIDELPELWNTLRGEMSLVGPRPEVPRYVDLENPLWQQVLEVKPGLTHPVSLFLNNEEKLLGTVAGDHEKFYTKTLLPLKLRGYIDYSYEQSWRSDVSVLWKTAVAIFTLGAVKRIAIKGFPEHLP